MHKLKKVAALLILVIIILTIASPWLIGIYFQRQYASILAFYNSFNGIHVALTDYKRHWFDTDAVLTVDVTRPEFLQSFNVLGISNKDILQHYTFEQHIKHGPVFFNTKNDFSLFGLVLIQNNLRLSPETEKFFHLLGVNENLIQRNETFITLNNNALYYFKFAPINIVDPISNGHFAVDNVEGNIMLKSVGESIKGKVKIQSLFAQGGEDKLSIPDFEYQFDITQKTQELWSGTSEMKISWLTATEEDAFKAEIQDIHYKSTADIVENQFNSSRELSIKQTQFNDQVLGPVQLHFSVAKMNAQALTDLITAYKAITQRGELYESQLEQKMLSMLPALISKGSAINLNNFDISDASGKLHINGKLQWNIETDAVPSELVDVLKSGDAQVDIHVSKPFLNEIIDFMVTSPLMNGASASISQEDAETASQDIYFYMQNNALLIDSLVNNAQLRETDALALIKLQDQMVPIQDYADEIKQILWSKYLTLTTSYFLYWGYTGLEQTILALEDKMQTNQEKDKEALHAQVSDFIKLGYIKEENGDYVVSIQQKNGILQINGHPLTQIPLQ